MVKLVDWPCASLSAAIHDVDFTVHVIVLYLGIVFIAEFSARKQIERQCQRSRRISRFVLDVLKKCSYGLVYIF